MTTDNGSRTGTDGERRALSKDERDFVAAMLSDTPHTELLAGLSARVVEPLADGGMGGLRFVSDKSRRRRELQIASDEFVDIDGVPVSVELTCDQFGDLFELECLKADSSPLKSWPKNSSADQLIGVVSAPLDPWDDFGSERRGLEHELFASRGIPADWMPWSSALRWNFPPTRPMPDSPVELRVGGDSPPRMLSELVDAVERGMGLWLALSDGFDLSQLAPLIPRLGYLTVVSQGTVTGWEVLDRARQLEQLIVRCGVAGVAPTAALPELRRVIGPGEVLGLACAGPRLVELEVDMASKPWPASLSFDGPIESLEIVRATEVEEPPRLQHPRELKTLRIHGARELDLSTLAPEVDLEWLEVDRTRVLRGADTIARMKRLRRLELENVASIPDAGALSAITAREVYVRRSDPAAAIALKR